MKKKRKADLATAGKALAVGAATGVVGAVAGIPVAITAGLTATGIASYMLFKKKK